MVSRFYCYSVIRDHSFSIYAKFSRKNYISYPLICNVRGKKCNFSENFAYLLNEWTPNDLGEYIKGRDICQKHLEMSKGLKSISVPLEVMKQRAVDICSLPNIDGRYRVEYNCILREPVFLNDRFLRILLILVPTLSGGTY